MQQAGRWLVGLTCGVLVAGCGAEDKPAPSAQSGTSPGGSGGASSGSGGSSGSNVGSSGATGIGGSVQPSCSEEQVACNGACVAVGASQNGCRALVRQEAEMRHLALDDSHVYVALTGTGRGIRRVARSSGVSEPFASDAFAEGLAINPTHVAWLDGKALFLMPKTGGTAVELLTDTVDLDGIAASAERVFFGRSPFGESHQIASVALDGSSHVDHGIAGFTSAPLLAVDESFVYWSSITGLQPDEIKRATHTGSEAEVMASVEGVAGLFVAGGAAYFEESDMQTASFGRIVKASSAGGALSVLVEQVKLAGDILFATSQHLYWSNQGTLMRANLDGQNATTVVSTSGRLVAAVADDAGLYVAINAQPLGPSYLLEIDR
jgi:hypothetical protein